MEASGREVIRLHLSQRPNFLASQEPGKSSTGPAHCPNPSGAFERRNAPATQQGRKSCAPCLRRWYRLELYRLRPARRSVMLVGMKLASAVAVAGSSIAALALAAPVQAAFPGANGRIGYAVAGGNSVVSESWVEIVRPDGSGKRRIDIAADAPAFSPGGRRIAFGDPFSARLMTMSPRGTRVRRLTRDADSEFDGSVDWSPSGRRLIFVRAYFGRTVTHLWVHSAGEDRLLVSDGRDPAWSVDGDIAFESSSLDRAAGLYLIRADGSGLRQVSPRGSTPDWSPSGRSIVFRIGSDIALMRSDGSGFRRLTRGPILDSDPAFSPDGKRIAFVRNRNTLLTMSPAGRDVRQVAKPTMTDREIYSPDWQAKP